jgi:hypothetical protein
MQSVLTSADTIGTLDLFTGASGDDTFTGTSGADVFDLTAGGDDTAAGVAGSDLFELGGALTAADVIDGGEGQNRLDLEGDYHKRLTLAPDTISGIGTINLYGAFGYNLKFDDHNVAAGQSLTVDAATFLDPAGKLKLDGSAETDGSFIFRFGANRCVLAGGAGDDSFLDSGSIDPGDHLKGGAGSDALYLFGASYAFGGKQLSGIEFLALDDFEETMHVVMADGDLAAGATMTVRGDDAFAVDFDASAERSGAYVVYGSRADDTLTGGGGADDFVSTDGADRVTGGLGADIMDGGGDSSADVFIYESAADSTRKAPDLVILGAGDVIDLSAIDARSDKAGDQAFRIVAAFDGHSGELVIQPDHKDGSLTDVLGDVDGDGRADLVIHLYGDQTGFTGFVL